MKNKFLKISALILCAVIFAGTFTVYFLYDNGQFKPAHGYVEPKDTQIRVACVGDSVTYGMTMKSWRKNAYPFLLREMLGEKYCVENFGFSGRTVSESGDRPYMSEKLYNQSIEFNPDIVILQIGSNDSKSYNWKSTDEFILSYKKLLESYINLPSQPEIIICTPPPAFKYEGRVKYDIDATVIENEIAPAVRNIALEYNLELIDLMEIFCGQPELFNDGLHPNEKGAEIFAQKVFDIIL